MTRQLAEAKQMARRREAKWHAKNATLEAKLVAAKRVRMDTLRLLQGVRAKQMVVE